MNSSEGTTDSLSQTPTRIWLALAAITALFFIMCVPTLNMGLWLDELITLNSVNAPDIAGVIHSMYGRLDDLHPPLSYIFLFCILHWFGVSDLTVRLPAFICGLLLIPAMYWLGKTMHSPKAGLIAAFLAAVSPFENYFACQSRGYSLATLLSAIALVLFKKLIDDEPGQKRNLVFVAFTLTAAALCYTLYISCIMIPVLGVAAAIISLRYFALGEKKRAAETFLRCTAALALACVLFLPWIPSVLVQRGYAAVSAPPTPLSLWPTVVTFSFYMLLPIPMLLSSLLCPLVVAVLFIYLLCNRKRIFAGNWLDRFRAALQTFPNKYIILLCAVIIPCNVIGYVTAFYVGYFRYMFPYAPAAWTLLAITLVWLFDRSKQSAAPEAATTPEANTALPLSVRGRSPALLMVLAAIFAVDVAYLCWFDSRPQSGLRTVAQDARSGKFDNSLMLIVPDAISPVLEHYLPADQRRAHNIELHAFPSWDNFADVRWRSAPYVKALWGPPEIVDQTVERIAKLSRQQGWKQLVVVRESDKTMQYMTTKDVPKLPRIQELYARIASTYPQITPPHQYAGVTEAVTITVFELAK